MGTAVTSLVNKPVGRFHPHEFWLHTLSLTFAMLAVVCAMPAKKRPQDYQCPFAGMLHDIATSRLRTWTLSAATICRPASSSNRTARHRT